MAIKKAYQDIVSHLEANPDKKVKAVLQDIIEMASAKVGGGRNSDNVLRDADGNVIAVFCYYHKMYEPVADVEYGKKATSSTGLNSMCKEGTSHWTKQQREAKKAQEELLDKVMAGELAASDLEAARAEIDKTKKVVVPREDKIGFATLEEAQKALSLPVTQAEA